MHTFLSQACSVRILALCGLLGFVGCGRAPAKGESTGAAVHPHEHIAPHGGTPVVLGKEEFHLELVWDAPRHTLTAYVLDGEMEQFVRIPASNFTVRTSLGGRGVELNFRAVANSATGESVGDTSQFEAAFPGFQAGGSFDGILSQLTIRGHGFSNVNFNFPKGNDLH